MNYEERDTYGMYKDRPDGASAGALHEGRHTGLMGANTLIGTDVHNEQAEDLGQIKEIMLDIHTGRIEYAVLSFGGFLGLGEKLFAVPWAALKLDADRKCFTLNIDKERVKTAPSFSQDEWPDMVDPTWSTDIHNYYGKTAASDI